LGSARGASLGYERVPDAVVTGKAPQDLAARWGLPMEPVEFTFATDALGFRNHKSTRPPDVILLGDSFLVAGLTPTDELLSAQLEARTDLAVTNVALIDLDVRNEFELLRESRIDVRGTTELHFGFEGNDQAGTRRSQPAEGAARNSLTRLLLPALQRWTQPVDPAASAHMGNLDGTPVYFLWTAEHMSANDDRVPEVLQALDDTRAWVHAHGARYAVVVIPSKLRVLGPRCTWLPNSLLADYQYHLSDLPTAVGRWASARRVPLLDLEPALFEATQRGNLPWWPADTHWNTSGQQAAADAIVAWSRQTDGVVLRPRGVDATTEKTPKSP
jgi:hypothetical protein